MPNNQLTNLIKSISKYDIVDVIARLSSLNLLQENQSRSFILDSFIAEILHTENITQHSSIIMSDGKFKKLIEQLNTTSLNKSIDPPENPFVQNVMLYGNYTLFNGIDTVTAYNVEMLGRILRNQDKYPKMFLHEAWVLITFCVNVSTEIANGIEVNLYTDFDNHCSGLIVPDSTIMKRNMNLVTIDSHRIDQDFIDTPQVSKILFDSFNSENIDSLENRSFYTKPFLLDTKNNCAILLNVGLLPTYIIYAVIKIAEKYNIKEQLINDYNNYIFHDCMQSLFRLGSFSCNNNQFDISLEDRPTYKEKLCSMFNDQIMILTYVCDNGSGYNNACLHDQFPIDNYLINKRIKNLKKKLIKHGISDSGIYFMCIHNFGLGRYPLIMLEKYNENDTVLLSPFELLCVSINESNNNGFFARYIKAKTPINNPLLSIVGELNLIGYYRKSKYTFYMGDDIDPDKTKFIIEPEYAKSYKISALASEKRHLIPSHKMELYLPCILKDAKRNIYVPYTIGTNLVEEVIEFSRCQIIWIYSDAYTTWDELNLYKSVIDMTSYWLGELASILQNAFSGQLNIRIVFDKNISEYYTEICSEKDNVINNFDTTFDGNELCLKLHYLEYHNFQLHDNSGEKTFIHFLLMQLKNHYGFSIDMNLFDEVFSNPFKKKFFVNRYTIAPYLKPVKKPTYRDIRIEDEERLTSEIGNILSSASEWSFKTVSDTDRQKVSSEVVDQLYHMLQNEVAALDSKSLLEIGYEDLEQTMYEILLQRKTYVSDIACYPENKDQYFERFNQNNKKSIALRFYLEYIAAQPPSGNNRIGIEKYEYILAICSLIIEWAQKNDLFTYDIIKTSVSFLPSKRIGMKHEEFDSMFNISKNMIDTELTYESSYNNSYDENYGIHFENYAKDINNAFLFEAGYSFNDMTAVIIAFIQLSESLGEKDVYVENRDTLIKELSKLCDSLSQETIINIVDSLTLSQRDNYLTTDKYYRKEDVYPWRLNRELSIYRKPLIKRDNQIIWGERVISHLLVYIEDLILTGKFKAHSKELQTVIGKISQDKGQEFNERIFNLLKSKECFLIYKNVKKINNLEIKESKGKSLGDIDVLIIDKEHSSIVVAELKSFRMARNPYEISQEHTKMFQDNGKKLCFVNKHLRRVNWVENHINDLIQEYHLEKKIWTVYGVFIVNEPIVSNQIYKQNIAIISESELSVESIRKIYKSKK